MTGWKVIFFPRVLTQIMLDVISKGKISPLARNIASIGRTTSKSLLVSETIADMPICFRIFSGFHLKLLFLGQHQKSLPILKSNGSGIYLKQCQILHIKIAHQEVTHLDKYEEQWNHPQKSRYSVTVADNDSFLYRIWEEEKNIQMAIARRRREEEQVNLYSFPLGRVANQNLSDVLWNLMQLKDRIEQSWGTWEEVYRNAKRADRSKHDLHERDEGELERTGQPLTIYEPYFGEGTWPFLHDKSLYRGIGMVSCAYIVILSA